MKYIEDYSEHFLARILQAATQAVHRDLEGRTVSDAEQEALTEAKIVAMIEHLIEYAARNC